MKTLNPKHLQVILRKEKLALYPAAHHSPAMSLRQIGPWGTLRDERLFWGLAFSLGFRLFCPYGLVSSFFGDF